MQWHFKIINDEKVELLTEFLFPDRILLARMQLGTVGCEKDDGLRH
jgi:hypothetical protein